MSSYRQKQEELFNRLEEEFKTGKAKATVVEPVEDYLKDKRICLTSVAFVPEEFGKIIQESFISPLRGVGSGYFYPLESLHMTIQNIRTVNLPPLFDEEDIEKARKVFREIVSKHTHFEVELCGLFELPTSLGIRGYSEESLGELAMELSQGLRKVGVPDNKKYASSTTVFGNVSICRYTTESSKEFADKVKELKRVEVGIIPIKKVSLITTNSVCHPAFTNIIEEFWLM